MHRRNLFRQLAGWMAAITSVRTAQAATAFPLKKTEAEWRKLLSPSAYAVLFEHGTERAGTSPLNAEKRPGTYVCAACHLPVFDAAQPKRFQARFFLWAHCRHHFATNLMLHLVLRRKLQHLTVSIQAGAGLKRTRLVVKPRMDYPTVSAGLVAR